MNNSQKRYDKYGWDYEMFNPLSRDKIDWYTNLAQKAGGRILELACGTGRLAAILAEAGFEVDGIDLSPLMLDIAKSRLKNLPVDIQSRLRFINGDITDFNLEGGYRLIILGDNSFQELTSCEDQINCLRCVHNHLDSDGIFLLAARFYQPGNTGKNMVESQWSLPIPLPGSEAMVLRRSSIRIIPENSIIERSLHYKTIALDGTERIESYISQAPLMSPQDYQSIFKEAGLKHRLNFDYSESSGSRDNSILCYICQKASP